MAAWIASVHVVIRSLPPVKSFAIGGTDNGLWPEDFPRGPPEALLTFVGCLLTLWSAIICLRFLTARHIHLFATISCLEHLLGMTSYRLSNFKPALTAWHSGKGEINGHKNDIPMFTYGRLCTRSPSTFWLPVLRHCCISSIDWTQHSMLPNRNNKSFAACAWNWFILPCRWQKLQLHNLHPYVVGTYEATHKCYCTANSFLQQE